MLYAITVLLSAFFLLLIQPVIGKFILPWFGGSPSVWTACLLFFQVTLLGGYSYAHLVASRLTPRKQAIVHVYMLAATLFLLPVIPSETWKPAADSLPTWQILGLLGATVGGPYFMLSSTGPLLQSWFSRVHPGLSPYRLYSVSNLGSLLAIVAYPLLIEPHLGLKAQAWSWSWGYVLFMLLCAACALPLWQLKEIPSPDAREPGSVRAEVASGAPSKGMRAIWLSLAAVASLMLLATTNRLCEDVAVVPLLWLVPLGLYLLSFILCFHNDRIYSRILFGPLLAATLAWVCVVLLQGVVVDLHWQIASYCAVLFISCMVCHGELARLKPAARHLTVFYLMVAGGGALGGLFVALAAPRLFKSFWEFHLGLAATSFLFLFLLFRDRQSPLHQGRPFGAWAFLYTAFVSLAVTLGVQIQDTLKDHVEMSRSFFGVLKVLDSDSDIPEEHRLVLMHGRIEHGYQFKDQSKRYWPTSYFGPNSGVGIAIRFHPTRAKTQGPRNLRVGIVGLGTGTLAAYGERGDYFRFYEINPDVLRVSDKYFSYRKDSPARIEVVLGDARISMERERARGQSQQFDVLAVDAFSSDAIPVHLLTSECYEIYRYHLKEDGILAMHISSRYFELSPVVRALAEQDSRRKVQALLVADDGSERQETDATRWILVTNNARFLQTEEVRQAVTAWTDSDPPPLLFTDDYSNLLKLMRR